MGNKLLTRLFLKRLYAKLLFNGRRLFGRKREASASCPPSMTAPTLEIAHDR